MNFELRARKNSYAIKNRITYPGAVYHLIQRAPGNEKLFLQEEDYLHILSLMKELRGKFQWKIFSFVLMPNHLHVLIQIKEENLMQGAKFLFQNYAIYFNKKYERKGSVFCSPYRAFLCNSEKYLLAISLYIHLNPYKAGLVSDPLRYNWSSVNLFVENKNYKTFVDYKFILSLLHPRDIKQAKEEYYRLLMETSGLDYKNILEEPNFVHRFCSEIIGLKKSYSLVKNKEKRNLDREIKKFRESKYSKKFSVVEKKNIIECFIKSGYSISEIKNFLNISRQHIYRLLNMKD